MAANPDKKINFKLMSETPLDAAIFEMQDYKPEPFKLNDRKTIEYIDENFIIDNGQEELNELSKMPSSFAFVDHKEVYDYIGAKLKFEPATQ